LPKVADGFKSVWAQYTITVKDRAEFQKRMTELGIPTSIHYPMIMPEQPWYKANLKSPKHDWTHSLWAAANVISLPLYPDMDEATQDRVIDAVKKSLGV